MVPLLLVCDGARKCEREGIGGAGNRGESALPSKASSPLTLGRTGNRPPLARFEGRGVSGLLSVQLSSLDDSIRMRSSSARWRCLEACWRMNFFTWVAMTASRSFSFDGEGALSRIEQTSGGGKVRGLLSSLRTCSVFISPRDTGSSSIWFFEIASTLREVRFTIFWGIDLILFLLTSRISSEVIWKIWDWVSGASPVGWANRQRWGSRA